MARGALARDRALRARGRARALPGSPNGVQGFPEGATHIAAYLRRGRWIPGSNGADGKFVTDTAPVASSLIPFSIAIDPTSPTNEFFVQAQLRVDDYPVASNDILYLQLFAVQHTVGQPKFTKVWPHSCWAICGANSQIAKDNLSALFGDGGMEPLLASDPWPMALNGGGFSFAAAQGTEPRNRKPIPCIPQHDPNAPPIPLPPIGEMTATPAPPGSNL